MSKSKSTRFTPRTLSQAIKLLEEGKYQLAKSSLLRLLEEQPGNFVIRRNAAICFFNAGNEHARRRRWKEAIQSYEHALSIDSNYPPIYYNLGLAYGYLPNYDLAKKWLKRALEFEPDDAQAHLALGFVHYDSGRKKKAREHLQRYLELEPDSDNAAPVRKILSSL